MQKTDKIDYAKLLGFDAVIDQLSGSLKLAPSPWRKTQNKDDVTRSTGFRPLH